MLQFGLNAFKFFTNHFCNFWNLKLKSCLKQQNYKFLLGATYHTVCSVFRLQGEHWWISVQCSGGIFSCLITFVISGKIFLVYPKPHPWYYFMGLAIGLYYLLWVIGLQYYIAIDEFGLVSQKFEAILQWMHSIRFDAKILLNCGNQSTHLLYGVE